MGESYRTKQIRTTSMEITVIAMNVKSCTRWFTGFVWVFKLDGEKAGGAPQSRRDGNRPPHYSRMQCIGHDLRQKC
jgi:hypothetical protein